MPLPETRISRMFMALAGAGALALALSGCEPKPKHEIGKVEYDKLVDWRELAKLGPQGARKYLGQTLTFKDLRSHAKGQKDDARENVCLEQFSAFKWGFDFEQPEPEVHAIGIGVYVNFGHEVVDWLKVAANDTLLTDSVALTPPGLIRIEDDICKKCRGLTSYNRQTKDYYGSQPVEECLLESRALHITGRVVGIDYEPNPKRLTLLLQPTGMAW